ncbi:MAG: nucleoside deaminase [Pegethrix bostrychoides GSE-TBD4-15B]|jgi:tRNA(Arg) A34 adenosine deaminase TadA|uniref:Nucleoside deaminase n=1 Tax=Pegethrix bostrychoides GSE-TBD4-15B TaxID=2839662 RepID=A0A951PAL0_9CYAN|nr:nucleoside deaminase [Pegethrix bostrychoides GSE-TBD4-15B]
MNDLDLAHLKTTIQIARAAKKHGNQPFGALLIDAEGQIVAEAENTQITEQDCTGHAETNLLRMVGKTYSPQVLAACTLYASTEPCPMCAGAIFWSGVGRLVYALSSQRFYAFDGDKLNQLHLGCRDILAQGKRTVRIEGPALEDEVLAIF